MTDENQTSIQSLQQVIAALEAQRAILGDAVVDASLFALRKQLAELEAAAVTQEQRKLATVLFADLAGFTALSEKLDPEDVRQLQQAYFNAVTPPIHEGGGWVEKYIGDAILAIFGLPQARENDPDLAVIAALNMQAALEQLNQSLAGKSLLPLEAPLRMRVGVNTGLVVISQKGPFDFTVTGDAVNVASRLQSLAPPGRVLISHDTYQHVRGAFDLQALEPIAIKGKTEPVQTYLALAVKPRSFRTRKRGVEGIETRMVGRNAEMQILQNAYYAAVEDCDRQMVTIVGEPGLGKSRLLYEFENWVDLRPERAVLFRCRARQETQHLPNSLLRDLFTFHFNIQDDDPLPVVWEKLENGLASSDSGVSAGSFEKMGQLEAHFIGQLLGYDFSASPYIRAARGDPQQIHDRGLVYLIDFFKRAAQRAPLVMFLEDLHWADDSSLDAIVRLALSLRELPALLVAAARPTLYERRENWMEGQDYHMRMDLRPLSKRDSRRLVEEVLQKVENLPDDLRDLLISNAEGNPFYLEELIKMLVEDGVIVKGQDNWLVQPERLKQAQVPPTLVGVLQARLDSLPEHERAILQEASVVGRVFWDKVVAHLHGIGNSESVERDLLALRDKEMIYRRELSTFAGSDEHIFKHAILREVTYESVLKRLRRNYHALAAEWLIGQGGERAGELTALIADHLEQAGKGAEAVAFLTRAGEEAAGKYLNQEAIQFVSRALALVPELDYEIRCALLLKREHWNDLLGRRDLQEQDLATIASLIEKANTETWAGEREALMIKVQLRRTLLYLMSGKPVQAEAAAQQALGLANAVGDQASLVEAMSLLANAHYRQGNYPEGMQWGKKALEIAQQTGDLGGQRKVLNTMGMIAQDQGDLESAKQYLASGLAIARTIGDRRGEASTQGNLATLAALSGELSEARDGYLAAVRICQEIGERTGEGTTLSNLGWLAGLWGDFESAISYCTRNLQIAYETDDRNGEVAALVNLSAFWGRQGSFQAALEHAQRGLVTAREMHSLPWTAWSLTYLGIAQSGLGQSQEAELSFLAALKIRQELNQPELATEPQAGMARAALAAGDLPGALSWVEKILVFLESGGSLEGTDEPLNVYLTCIHVLRANHDSRAARLVEQAYGIIQNTSARIHDESSRRSYLENVPWHREIIALWQQHSPV